MAKKRRRFRHYTIAMVYDFDGTLTPQAMQDYTVLPQLGIPASRFWKNVQAEVAKKGGDPMLTYMRLLIEQIEANKTHLSRNDLRKLGKNIRYFPGVDGWFDRIAKYVADQGEGVVKLRNYIISAGQREILEGIRIRKHFARIFASEYYFDHHDRAVFPRVLVNDTIKTQYIFRINKGREDLSQSINEHMPESARRIPFSNIIYLGDGMTDVPGMTVTKNNGGYAIAVHPPRVRKSLETCRALLKAGRVDFYAPADYSTGKVLEKRVKLILDMIIARIRYEKEIFSAKLVER